MHKGGKTHERETIHEIHGGFSECQALFGGAFRDSGGAGFSRLLRMEPGCVLGLHHRAVWGVGPLGIEVLEQFDDDAYMLLSTLKEWKKYELQLGRENRIEVVRGDRCIEIDDYPIETLCP